MRRSKTCKWGLENNGFCSGEKLTICSFVPRYVVAKVVWLERRRATAEDPCLHTFYSSSILDDDLTPRLFPWSTSFFFPKASEFFIYMYCLEKFLYFFFLQKFFLIQITSFKTLSLEVMHFPPKILKILSKNYWKEFPLSFVSATVVKSSCEKLLFFFLLYFLSSIFT
mgnify:CR=1 FL=1